MQRAEEYICFVVDIGADLTQPSPDLEIFICLFSYLEIYSSGISWLKMASMISNGRGSDGSV